MFLFLAALVTLVGSAEAVKIAAIAALGESADVSTIQKALDRDPGNPLLHNRLSQLLGDSTVHANLTAALEEARRATALNPNKSDYWLTLASACESSSDNACADQALKRAMELSPMVPQVWWIAGNHFLRTDQTQAALLCFHRLLALSPDLAAPTFELTLRAYDDPQMILDKVVGDNHDPALGLAFADFMSANAEFDAAHQAWARIAGGGAQFPFAAVQPYIERLLGHGRYQEAQAIWSNLEERGVIARPADSDHGNLIFDGGFEQLPLGAGFDWRSQPSPYVSLDFADASPFAGAHCLRVDFPIGQNDEFEPVFQIVPVVPNRPYSLAADVRSSDIMSDSGPRLRVIDPDRPACLDASTDATVGSTPWHRVALRFSTGPQTQAVRISLWRPRSRVFPMEISGTFWLDDVSLRAEQQ
ncbi:MAG: tetratricopeptide repeat protein [Terriglobia bacterium]